MSLRRIAATLVVASFGIAAAQARPIRTNTPGTGVFIGSGVVLQTICDQLQAADARLSSCRLVGDFRFSPATHWVLGARLPLYAHRQADFGGDSLSDQGFGDLEVSAKWRFFRQVGPWFDRHAAIELGLKLPTGDSELPSAAGLPLPLAHRLAPGSGSTDAFVDLVYQQGQRRFLWGGDLLYRRNGEGENGYRIGDLLQLSFDGEYIAFPRQYTKPGHEVFLLLEGAVVHRFADELGPARLATGGTELLLAPGVQYIATEQMLLSLSWQLAVWSDVEVADLESDWNLLAEIRYAF